MFHILVEYCKFNESTAKILPEPEEDVYLFVDDIDCKHTEPIPVFDCSRWTKQMESALGYLNESVINDYRTTVI